MSRFLVIAVTKGNPNSDGTVFESQDGVRFVVTAAKTRTEADAKLSAAGPDAKIFAVRPRVQHAGGGVGCKRSFVLGFKGAEEISAQQTAWLARASRTGGLRHAALAGSRAASSDAPG